MPNPPKKVIDTRSGRVFPALNQCYLVLLREGELEEMRRAGKLKDNPEEDTFGYYRMRRFYPGRFEPLLIPFRGSNCTVKKPHIAPKGDELTSSAANSKMSTRGGNYI